MLVGKRFNKRPFERLRVWWGLY